ncbi:MAG: hypothetical protein PVH04_00270 [Gammaproteobacteria bacterium]
MIFQQTPQQVHTKTSVGTGKVVFLTQRREDTEFKERYILKIDPASWKQLFKQGADNLAFMLSTKYPLTAAS